MFAPNGGYSVYFPSNRLRNVRSFEIGEQFRTLPSFSWGIFCHVMCLDQSRASENISRIISMVMRGITCGWGWKNGGHTFGEVGNNMNQVKIKK